MIYSLFYGHNSFEFSLDSILGQQLLFKRKHRGVVTIRDHVYRKLRGWSWSVRSLGRKKGSRLRLLICFQVVEDVPEKKGMDLWKQMSSSKCSFTCICGIVLPLNLRDYSLCPVCILPQPAFYFESAVRILHTVFVLPLVLSLQSAVRSLRFTLTGLTIIPWARMGSKAIAHEAEGWMSCWLRDHEGERNNCFRKIQLVGEKKSRQNNFG